MPFPDDPSWGAVGFKDNINRVLHSEKVLRCEETHIENSQGVLYLYFALHIDKMSFLNNH